MVTWAQGTTPCHPKSMCAGRQSPLSMQAYASLMRRGKVPLRVPTDSWGVPGGRMAMWHGLLLGLSTCLKLPLKVDPEHLHHLPGWPVPLDSGGSQGSSVLSGDSAPTSAQGHWGSLPCQVVLIYRTGWCGSTRSAPHPWRPHWRQGPLLWLPSLGPLLWFWA